MQKTPISYLIDIAEQKKEEALHALDIGDPDAEEQFRQWASMLETLQRLRRNGLLELVSTAAR